MKTILFQGDSITDAGRTRNTHLPNVGLGGGYVTEVAGKLLLGRTDIEIYNRGISGERTGSVYARWHEDTLNIDYDLLSILLGINDVGYGIRLSCGPTPKEFRFIYDHMIEMAMERHPLARLVLCQPFVLPVDHDWPPYGNDVYRDYAVWEARVTELGNIVAELAKKWGATFVPMFDALRAATKTAPAAYFSEDGIHPNAAGSAVIADAWLSAVGEI